MLDSLTVNLPSHFGLAAGDKRLLASVFTTRCSGGTGAGLERFLPPGRTSFFGYGRQALAEGLLRLRIDRGDEVLLPGFVCRDVLASLAAVGAIPRFYDVNEALQIELPSLIAAATTRTRAALVVNYFGFPQPLKALKDWCTTRGVAVVEDNAHGFLSEDGSMPLGLRGDLGVFSLRKTLSIPNGAALVDNRPTVPAGKTADDRALGDWSASPWRAQQRHRTKAVAKRLMMLGGPGFVRGLINAKRSARRLVMGEALPTSGPDAETVVPRESFAPLTARLLRRLDVRAERVRRRDLFAVTLRLMKDAADVKPIFSQLADGVVPQGLPILFSGRDPERFMADWWRRGLPLVRWPELPAALGASAPIHYRRIMLIPFGW